jgi:beta-phosphoglucomutase-like phosphatase (HAD superfamily)
MNQIALKAVLFDIDGTLIDSNDAHTQAWVQTLERHGRVVSYEQVRSLIGKGSDKVFAELLDIDSESDLAKQITKDRTRRPAIGAAHEVRRSASGHCVIQRRRATGIARAGRPAGLARHIGLFG